MRNAAAARSVAVFVLGSLLPGCDQGSPDLAASSGPALRIVGRYPPLGSGLDCAPDDHACGVPRNVSFEFRFDRFLRPDSAIRQAMTVYTGAPSNVVQPGVRLPEIAPEYDLVERVVRYTLPEGLLLHENALYTLELAYAGEDGAFGFAAFDGAPLDRDTPLSVSFVTSNQLEERSPSAPTPSCDDVVALFSGCASSACHGGDTPRMGLDLTSAEAMRRTAIGRVARQTETGATTGIALQNPARTGVAMPIIDPHRPDNSYLLYKLLIAADNYRPAGDCQTEFRAEVDPELCTRASDDELERLRDSFVRGEPMPHPASARRLGPEGVRSVERFIRAGATCL